MPTMREMEEQAAKKLHAALPDERPARIRKREIFWIFVCLALAGAYVGQDDYVDAQVIAEAQKTAAEKKAKLFANLLAECFNGKSLVVAGDVIDCKPRKK